MYPSKPQACGHSKEDLFVHGRNNRKMGLQRPGLGLSSLVAASMTLDQHFILLYIQVDGL